MVYSILSLAKCLSASRTRHQNKVSAKRMVNLVSR